VSLRVKGSILLLNLIETIKKWIEREKSTPNKATTTERLSNRSQVESQLAMKNNTRKRKRQLSNSTNNSVLSFNPKRSYIIHNCR